MANTPNFNWETPDDTDLVKDGAAAIRTLAGAIDTSLVDLKGGTTGQVLAKNSNTDMDFVWSADASGIPATIFDAKGDLIVASAADTAARLAVGTNGHTLVADSAEATGLKWAAPSSGALTLVSATSFTGVTGHVVNNCFTSTYVNYKIFINFSDITGSNPTFSLLLRASGTNTTSGYLNMRFAVYDGGANIASFVDNGGGGGAIGIGFGNTSSFNQRTNIEITMLKPQLAQPTQAITHSLGSSNSYNGFISQFIGSQQSATTQFDGFEITASTGNINGTVKVYGLQN